MVSFLPPWRWLRLAVALAFLPPAAVHAADTEGKARVLVVAKQQTVLSAQIAGRIARLGVTEGDRFRKGQVLAALDCQMNRLQLNEYQADYHGAEKTLSVQKQLAGLNSGSALEAALAEANMGKVKAKIAMAEANIEMCDVKAPFDGRVVERKVNPYQNVTAGQAVLEILDDSSLEVELIVPSAWLSWLKVGVAFTVAIDENGRDYGGKVIRTSARIDPASQSLKVVGELTAPDARDLVPGMSGVARFGKP